MTTYTIEVTLVYPPLPVRDWDYCATFKGYEPGESIGYGPTEYDAIVCLLSMALAHSNMFKERA